LAGVALPKAVQDVLDECVAAFGENLKAALWHGSWARGEARPGSDHDLILIFRRVDDGVLLTLRDIFRERENWSTYVRSEAELRQTPADRHLQFAFGFRLLHGDFEPLPVSRENVLAEMRSLADEISFQCRYRLVHKHADWPRQVHMMQYMAKNCLLIMKARHLLHHGHYPETRAELRSIVDDPAELEIIDWVERWEELRPGFEADPAPLMLHLDTFARRLVDSLPSLTKKQPNKRT
jgi:predicted nucleotidyltransferase